MICTGCATSKPVDDFYIRNGKPIAQCKECSRKRTRKWQADNKAQHLATKRRSANKPDIRKFRQEGIRAKKYGMTRDQLRAFLEDNPNCTICGEPASQIDHDHITGKVRGHLCRPCNVGLGHFKEDTAVIHAAILYIERNKND